MIVSLLLVRFIAASVTQDRTASPNVTAGPTGRASPPAPQLRPTAASVLRTPWR